VLSDVVPQFKRTGISGKGKNIVTKHDPEICGRKNARKVMENVRTHFMSVYENEGLSVSMHALPHWPFYGFVVQLSLINI